MFIGIGEISTKAGRKEGTLHTYTYRSDVFITVVSRALLSRTRPLGERRAEYSALSRLSKLRDYIHTLTLPPFPSTVKITLLFWFTHADKLS